MKLAYDIGGYDGSDTAHYLNLGYDVVCVEASPDLAEKIRKRFAGDPRVTVLNIGVGNQSGTLPFYLSFNPIWNSFDRGMAARAGEVREVAVPIRPLADVLEQYGQPEFVKIDVEGADYDCLRSLAVGEARPRFLTCEASRENGELMILEMIAMGYSRFTLIRQDSFDPLRLPTAGTPAAVKWSARQWLRQALRRKRWLLKMLAALKPSREGSKTHASGTAAVAIDSAGPTPMEYTGAWYTPGEFLWAWKNCVDSGLIDSVWWDIHAVRR